jgi:uncharacterized protein with HEPN domain
MQRDHVLVVDMLRLARQAARAGTGVTAEQLVADPDLQAMVLWPLAVLDEAAAHVSEPFRTTHPEVPWRKIVGLRNVLIHDYSGVDMAAVVEVVRTQLPGLIVMLEAASPDESV